jgi:hypothetical protein
LIDTFGKVSAIATLSFIAYILGSMVEVKTPRIFGYTRSIVTRLWPTYDFDWVTKQALLDLAMKVSIQASKRWERAGKNPAEINELITRSLGSLNKLEREREQLATRLHAKNAELFGDHDRKAAEAGFRINMGISILAGCILVGATQQAVAFLFVPISIWLIWRGCDHYRQSNDVLIQAIMVDEIHSSTVVQNMYPPA